MLRSLTIKNLVLIGDARLEFSQGLNVLSGETGAGKSIIVDAIMLLIGEKYDKSLLRYGEDSGYVEGVFDLTEKACNAIEDIGLEAEDPIIVTRRFSSVGKNEVRVNGRNVSLSMLRPIAAALIDVYGQHDYLSIAKISEQQRIFDYYARHNIQKLLQELSESVKKFKIVVKELDDIGDAGSREREIDILAYQIEEIEKADVKDGEEQELGEKRKMAAAAEKISSALLESINSLEEGEENAATFLSEACDNLDSIGLYNKEYRDLAARIDALNDELSDICDGIRDCIDECQEPIDTDAIEYRLDVIKNLRKKYGDYVSMRKFLEEASDRLFKLKNADKNYTELLIRKERLLDEIYLLSVKLSRERRVEAEKFRNEVLASLGELGMVSADFSVHFAALPERDACEKFVSEKGMDSFEFYFSANAGQPLQPMIKVISGGEMSRFMLALKAINGEQGDIPTMIFDEIDTGISGSVGRAVAKKLAQISLSHQVMCVTHLPQIAAMASSQFFIEKKVIDGSTVTLIDNLQREGMVKEIARLSGSLGVSENALAAADELKRWCEDYVKEISH